MRVRASPDQARNRGNGQEHQRDRHERQRIAGADVEQQTADQFRAERPPSISPATNARQRGLHSAVSLRVDFLVRTAFLIAKPARRRYW
jgi:hypothetical protein